MAGFIPADAVVKEWWGRASFRRLAKWSVGLVGRPPRAAATMVGVHSHPEPLATSDAFKRMRDDVIRPDSALNQQRCQGNTIDHSQFTAVDPIDKLADECAVIRWFAKGSYGVERLTSFARHGPPTSD
jgi:hypothetical protein